MSSTLVLALLLVGGPHPAPAGIKWEGSFEEALRRARTAGKPVMINFWAEWCGWCHRLDQTTYVDPLVVKLSERFVSVKIDTEGAPAQVAVAARYDVSSLPTILFVSPSGRQVARLSGFQGPGTFPSTLEAARDAATRVMAWEAALEKNAKDPEALMLLGIHLFEQEFYEDSRDLLQKAAKLDKDRPPEARRKTRMLVGIIQTYDRRYADSERVLREALAIEPGNDQEAKLLFVLGRNYLAWGKAPEARETMQRILDEHASSPVAPKARETLAALDRRKN